MSKEFEQISVKPGFMKHNGGLFFRTISEKEYEFNTYHTFVVQVSRRRDELKNFLLKNGINTAIHYPIPIHLQPASKKLNYKVGDFKIAEDQANKILTLPIHQNLNQKTIKRISDLINYFFTSL